MRSVAVFGRGDFGAQRHRQECLCLVQAASRRRIAFLRRLLRLFEAGDGKVGGVFDGEFEGEFALFAGFEIEAPDESAVFLARDFATGFVLGAGFFFGGSEELHGDLFVAGHG